MLTRSHTSFALFAALICSLASARAAGQESPRATLALDGTWQIVTDANNVGRCQCWHQPAMLAKQPAVPIKLPSCWEETLKDYEGGCLPFWFDVSERLGLGKENILLVRKVGPAVNAESLDIRNRLKNAK